MADLAEKVFGRPTTILRSINMNHVRKFLYYARTGSWSALSEKVIRKLREVPQKRRVQKRRWSIEKGVTLDRVSGLEFQNHPEVRVSIVIPVRNQWGYTYRCLKSIIENSNGTPYEVIVVDDGSTDETTLMLGKIPSVRILRSVLNRGFVDSCNWGSAEARGEYVLFLNNDTLVTRGWLEPMVKIMDRDDSVGLVGAKLLYPDGSLQEAGGIIWNRSVYTAAKYGRGDDPARWEYDYLKEVDYCSAACLLVRREVLKKLGFFNTRYAPGYFEDVDLAFRAREMGYKTVYQPQTEVIHIEGGTAGVNESRGMKRYQAVNQRSFYTTWKDRLRLAQADTERDLFLARDRSVNKKIMLYVDHYVPAQDKDAGSYITVEYLKIFLSLGYKIIFWPDNLVAIEPYTTELQQMGIEVVYGSVSFRTYMKKYGRHISVAVLSRPHIAPYYIDTVIEQSEAAIIYIPHDLNFLRESRRAMVEKNSRLLAEAEKLKEKELQLIRKSHVTVVFSEKEQETISRIEPGATVEVAPWIKGTVPPAKPFADRNTMLFLGGFAHLPNEDGVCWFVESVFPFVRKALPSVKFIIAGSHPTKKVLQLQSEDIVVTGFVPDPSPLFHDSKVFVAPLRYGAGLKGKIIHAMSFGVPVVTTEIGAEGIGMEDGNNGFVATDPADFAKKVIELFQSEALWNAMSQKAYRHVDDCCSETAAKKFFSSLLQS